jgi:hypothetical protein
MVVSSAGVSVIVIVIVVLVCCPALACGVAAEFFRHGAHHGFGRCVYGAREAAGQDLHRSVGEDLDLDLVLN